MKLGLLLFAVIQLSSALNILLYLVAMGKSHLDFTDSLVDTLVERGHTVDLVIARFNPLVKGDGKSRADRIYSYGFTTDGNWTKSQHLINPFVASSFGLFGRDLFGETALALCELGLNDDGLSRFLNKRKYDVAIGTDYEFCGFAMFHKWGIPSVASMNAIPVIPGQGIVQGLPSPASVTSLVLEFYDLDTFTGRLCNLLKSINNSIFRVPYLLRQFDELIFKHYGDNFPSALVLSENIDVLFINANEILDRPRPISHKFRYIGGINTRKADPVSEQFDRILSSAPRGNVLFCFGTQVPSENFPLNVKVAFLEAFRQFPDHRFIWKYTKQPEDDELFQNITNVHTFDWIPQNDLLNDNRVVAFISHMGMNSYMETSFAGKPTLSVPLFFDQNHNALAAKEKGISYLVPRTSVTAQTVTAGLTQILTNTTYTDNSQRIQKMLYESPVKAKETFVDWVEFISRNPGYHKVQEMPGRRMSPIEYYSLDFLALAALSIIILSCILFWTLRLSLRYRIKSKTE